MLQDPDSSDDSDAGTDSIFLPGRHKRVQQGKTETQPSLDTPNSEVSRSFPFSSPSKFAKKISPGVSLDEDGRRDSLGVNQRMEVESGGSIQGSPHKATPLGSRTGSRQGSPLPADLSDFVIVSKGLCVCGVPRVVLQELGYKLPGNQGDSFHSSKGSIPSQTV